MLQYVTICYSMLQYVTVSYNMVQYGTVRYSMLQYVTVCCNTSASCLFNLFVVKFKVNHIKPAGLIGEETRWRAALSEVQIPAGAFFCSFRRPYRLWNPPSLLLNGYRGSIPDGRASGA